MAISATYESRRRIAVREFGDIIVTAEVQQLSLLYSILADSTTASSHPRLPPSLRSVHHPSGSDTR